MRRWELPVFSLATLATWIALGLFPLPLTINVGGREAKPEWMRVFAAYLSPGTWAMLIGMHILCSLTVGLLAWGAGFAVQFLAARKAAPVMSRFIARCRELPMRTALTILGISVSALLFEGLVVCGLGFQPGWANGWPGASKPSVFAAFLSGALFLMLVSAGAAGFAVPCSLLQRLITREYVGWGAFASLMLVWAVRAAILSAGAFPALRAWILKEWP